MKSLSTIIDIILRQTELSRLLTKGIIIMEGEQKITTIVRGVFTHFAIVISKSDE